MNAPQLAQVAGALIADGKGTLLSCPKFTTAPTQVAIAIVP